MICGKFLKSTALPHRLMKIGSGRPFYFSLNNVIISKMTNGTSTKSAAMGPHALQFKIERYFAAGMFPLLPAAYFIHGTTMDLLLSAAIVMHSHWLEIFWY